jgi:hypothetical protein
LEHYGSGVNVEVLTKESNTYVDGIIIDGITINGSGNTTIGLKLNRGTRFQINNVNINRASDCGIKQTNDMWISSFTNIYIGDCRTGLYIEGPSVTSIYLNEIYVNTSTYRAYNIRCEYSTIGTLAADNCSGDAVYRIYYFSGSIDSLACENSNVMCMYRFSYTQASIGLLYAWNPVLDDNLVRPFTFSDSNLEIAAIKLSAPSAIVSEKNIGEFWHSYIRVTAIRGNMTFSGATSPSGSATSVFSVSGLNQKILGTTGSRAYLGVDRTLPAEIRRGLSSEGVAIFTDCLGSPAKLANGTNVDWSTPVHKGDWFIENDPKAYGVAGYVILEDHTSGQVSDAKKSVIPYLISGTTANRPAATNFPKGAMYFDTTLNKPIYWTGTAWVDATGGAV